MRFVEKVLNSGGKIKKIDILIDELKSDGIFNPSIFNDNGNLYVVYRFADYTLFYSENQKYSLKNEILDYVPYEENSVTSKNYIGILDQELNIIKTGLINTEKFDTQPKWFYSGLEDPRLVKWDDKFFICGVRRDTDEIGTGKIEISEIVMGEDRVEEVSRIQLPDIGNFSYCEKNWMPILDKPYHFIRWSNPTEVVKYNPIENKTELVTLKPELSDFDNSMRGGSHVIAWKDSYLGIVHLSNHMRTNDGKFSMNYKHKIILWDKEWNIIKVSPQFSLMGGSIEFVSGITIHKNMFIISFGFQDSLAFLLEVPIKFMEDFLNG